MAYGLEILRRLESINEEEIIARIAKQNEKLFADFNRAQLREGKDNTGNYLPSYLEDPYFKTKQGSWNYMMWKSGISPNKDKPIHIADFYIRGDYHESIDAIISGTDVTTQSYHKIAEDISRKTSYKALGINPDSAVKIYNGYIHPSLLQEVSSKTGIK